jgi:PAS domain S-box-containing protein
VDSLADFLSTWRDELVERFKARVGRTLAPLGLSDSALQDHLPDFLDATIQALRDDVWPPSRLFARNSTAEEHGRQRLRVGFSLDALTREYGLLRDCILELLEESGEQPRIRELRILSDCVSAATADSVTQYVEHQQTLLRESEARLQAIIDNAPAAIYVKDPGSRWLIVNHQMEHIFGRRREELLGQRDEDLMTPEAAAALHVNDARVLASNAPVESEEVVPLADGPHTYLSLKFPLRDAQGRATAVCGISTDITERRRVQDFQQRLLGIVGHDIRGPLAAISLTTATLLEQGSMVPAHLRAVQRIAHSAQRMERLVTLLLDFTRAQLGLTLPLRREPVGLDMLGERVLEEVRTTRPGRTVQMDVRGDVRGEWDPDRLMQVLGNLLSNALRYSPADTPVDVRMWGSGEAVLLQVHNAGAPIPAEALPRLFEPFCRGAQAERTAKEGLGLGLYIVGEVVRAHGGTLTVDSSEEQGTTFSILLPRREASAYAPSEPAPVHH